MMFLRNCKYLQPDGTFADGGLIMDGGKIRAAGPDLATPPACMVRDLGGATVIPGLIDMHFHGALGREVIAAKQRDLEEISFFLAHQGTTTYLPTTISAAPETLLAAVKEVRQAWEAAGGGASIAGLHLEGPFISVKFKGCHEAKHVRPAEAAEYAALKSAAGPLKLHFTVAPEVGRNLDFIKTAAAAGNSLALGHTDADSWTAQAGLAAGAGGFTHLFNAMRGFHHREPGAAGCALIGDAYAELICDGIHVHPDAVKLAYKAKGRERLILVTDAMHASGLGDGEYAFCGQKVIVHGGVSRSAEGVLAGTTMSLLQGVKNLARFAGIPLGEAVLAATRNPAAFLGILDRVGTLEAGKRADVVVLDEAMNVRSVYCRGQAVPE